MTFLSIRVSQNPVLCDDLLFKDFYFRLKRIGENLRNCHENTLAIYISNFEVKFDLAMHLLLLRSSLYCEKQ